MSESERREREGEGGWPEWTGEGEEPGWWMLHPAYGPCDGFGPGGTCATCRDVIARLFKALRDTV